MNGQAHSMNREYLQVSQKEPWYFFFVKSFSPSMQFYWFLLFLAFFYIVSPLVAGVLLDTDRYAMLLLSRITAVAICALLLGYGYKPSFFQKKLFVLNTTFTVWSFYAFFLLLIVVIIATSEKIPLVMAFSSEDVGELAVARAAFLKARMGYQESFRYLTAILTTSFIPYVLVLAFSNRLVSRWFVFLTAYFFSFLFLEKVFFLKFVLPLLCWCSFECMRATDPLMRKKQLKFFAVLFFLIPVTIYVNTSLSRFGGGSIGEHYPSKTVGFYSAKDVLHVSDSRLHFILWRIFAVPVFTATDSLNLFHEKYEDQLLLGKTSRLVATLTHQENIHFEHEVFLSQWGDEATHTASANAVYFIEQYVNFGWVGVFISSFLIGVIFRILRRIDDVALSCLAMMLSFSLALGGFMSTFLSGGFLFLFLFRTILGLKR